MPVPQELHEAIETERGNLSKAESVLGCLMIAMEYEADSVIGPYYPDVVQLAQERVRKSIYGEDSLALQRGLLRNEMKETFGVRERLWLNLPISLCLLDQSRATAPEAARHGCH